MDNIKQNIILFRRTPQCFWTIVIYMLLVIASVVIKSIYYITQYGIQTDIVSILQMTLNYQLFSFVIFLFVSYEFSSQDRRNHTREILQCVQTKQICQESVKGMILLGLVIIFFLANAVINLIFAKYLDAGGTGYYLYIFKILTLYIIGTNVIAILSGMILSHITMDNLAYGILVVIAFYSTVRARQLFYSEEHIGMLDDLTQFFCVGAGYTINYGMLIPLGVHFISKTILWILFLLVIYLAIYIKQKRDAKLILTSTVALVCMSFCVVGFRLPVGGNLYGYCDIGNLVASDASSFGSNTKDNLFSVSDYDIEYKIGSCMDASVKMKLSSSDLKEYCFTLFQGYHIDSITSNEGLPLDYQVKGNYLKVYNEDSNLDSIIVRYTGTGTNKYYACKNGIYLPGNFPYYPMAGIHEIREQGLCELPNTESNYHVIVQYAGDIFSNIKKEATAVHTWTLSGSSNNLCIVAGCWEESTIDGIDYIYPNVSSLYNISKNTYLRNAIHSYVEDSVDLINSNYTIKGKKIIIAPFGFEAGNYMFGTDSMVLESETDLSSYYTNYVQTGSWYLEEEPIEDVIPEE